ncbi:hypothetical protein H5410_021012, partial [Solanum commersonii]
MLGTYNDWNRNNVSFEFNIYCEYLFVVFESNCVCAGIPQFVKNPWILPHSLKQQISSICKDNLKFNSLTETTLREMKGSFHTDVPPSYMNYVENRVAENLGQEYVQRKELYYVK